ncbi:MAG: GTP-binding protein [Oscillospiraceae bacterium]|nr:GTP-binding protein [Oscillospiraceae bacterium]MBQ5870731.1 GTP-binding protein [Lachnospiraceae bacterium]
MTKIDIFSGFLGAGKTTLIRKLIEEAYKGQKIVLIENEFGDIAIDGGFLQDAGVEITEMNSGCICCTLVGDFKTALEEVIEKYQPDRVIIEPSGVGKLSDVAKAVASVADHAEMGAKITVVDATKCKMYIRNFGEFFNDQVQYADVIALSRTAGIKEEKLMTAVQMLKELNPDAQIVSTPWEDLTGDQFMAAMEHRSTLAQELAEMASHEEEHEHHHHHHDEDEEHEHHHHHHDEDEEHEHHHHHHDEDEEHEHHHHHHDDEEHEHHHHHDGEECGCGHHHHHDHDGHHHHADEIFTSWGAETPKKYTEEEVRNILDQLGDEEKYGMVLRAKGMLNANDSEWIYFDYVPEEVDIRKGAPILTGRFCVIGSKIKEDALKELFGIE